jgi:hypothetical protein
VAEWHLAQLNVARAVAPLDHPAMADFIARLEEINTLGDRSPGFVWRLQGDGGTSTEPDSPMIPVHRQRDVLAVDRRPL